MLRSRRYVIFTLLLLPLSHLYQLNKRLSVFVHLVDSVSCTELMVSNQYTRDDGIGNDDVHLHLLIDLQIRAVTKFMHLKLNLPVPLFLAR